MWGTYPIVGLILWSKWSWTNRQTMLDFPTPVSWKSKKAWQWVNEVTPTRPQMSILHLISFRELIFDSLVLSWGKHGTLRISEEKWGHGSSFSNISIVSESPWPSSQDSLLSKPSNLLGGFYIPVARTAVHPAEPFTCTSKPCAFQHTAHYRAQPEEQFHSGLLHSQPKQASKTD